MMQRNISRKTNAYIFDEISGFLTYVYAIFGEKYTFIIDTFCGKKYMEEVLDDVNNRNPKEIIVINTHFHWDHVWGNEVFKKNKIIAHKSCADLIQEKWDEMIEENVDFADDDLIMTLPNVFLEKTIDYPEDGISIFYSPGHTDDCISVFDHEEKILYAGDNLEKPQIFIESPNVNNYIESLKFYLTLKPKKIMAGHTMDMTVNDIHDTIKYLERFKS